MNEEKSTDWIGLIIILFFVFFPLLSSLFKRKQRAVISNPQKITPPPLPKTVKKTEKTPAMQLFAKSTFSSKKRKKKPKSILIKYGSLKNGIILSEILKRPYID